MVEDQEAGAFKRILYARLRAILPMRLRTLRRDLETLAFAIVTVTASPPAIAAGPAQTIVADPLTGRIEVELANGEKAVPAALYLPWLSENGDSSLYRTAYRQILDFSGGDRLLLEPDSTRDRYDRPVGRLLDQRGAALDELLISSGLAVVDPPIGRLPSQTIARLLDLEDQARGAGLGVWARDHDALIHSPDETESLAGHFALVEGRVLQAGEARQYLYLNFGEDWRSDFTVRADRKLYRRIKRESLDLATLAGQTIRVRGWVFEENGPMIEILRAEQIEIIR